ncbi:alpha/beta hydrolase family protein [Polymorphospora rubra]|uniref:Serine aminopeptidase S33 domain-containing protein n=1 Tax=Polymorphospora rubra TaxID=338584 RepID=A0A810N5D0_9ACTN|nr:alpha/beta fold hydrolase [Polymorphospora rubra]BCJ66675.1 hypothetical protein Prubr_36960 [Polymorphospora rubra]
MTDKPGRRRRRLVGLGLVGLLTVVTAVLAVQLGARNLGGVPHRDVVIDGRIPATMYVPGAVPGNSSTVDLPPSSPGGLPAVVLAHGHSADRSMMNWLARRLADAGFVVVTFDFRGHGGNTDRHEVHGFGGRRADLTAVYDWAAAQSYVDDRRIAVAGHSMGAAAVVDFATHDARPVATMALGGSVASVEGGVTARNMLFLVAQGDPVLVRDEAVRTAEEVFGGDIDFGSEYGDIAAGSAVGLREIANSNHLSMLYAGQTADLMADWMDRAAGPGAAPRTTDDDTRLLAVLYLAAATGVLFGLGLLAGTVAGRQPGRRGAGWRALPLVLVAVVLPIPFLAWGDAGLLLGVEAGGALALLLGVAGILLLAVRRLEPVRRWLTPAGPVPAYAATTSVAPPEAAPEPVASPEPAAAPVAPAEPAGAAARASDPRRPLVPVALAVGGLLLVLLPVGPTGHTLVPTPARIVIALLMALVMLPFFHVVDGLLRAGSPVAASGWSLAARVLILAAVMVGVGNAVLPGMLGLYLMVLAPFLILLELVVAGVYVASRDPRLTAPIQALALGWLLATISPVVW